MCQISVIIPVYNREKLVAASVESVVNQTYLDWELIVVDDFSTDKTDIVLNELILKYARKKIYYIKNENKKGVSGARNTGMSHAKGKYIALLDSDDLWDKDNLKLKIKTLNLHPELDALFSDTFFLGGSEGEYICAHYINKFFHDNFWVKINKELLIAKGVIIPFMLRYGFPFCIPSLIFKKELLLKSGYFNEDMIYHEDSDFIFRCFCVGKIGYLNKKLCFIRQHSLNTHKIYSEKFIVESELVLVKNMINYAKCFNVGIADITLKEVLRDAHIRRASFWFKDNKFDEARKCIMESIRIKLCMKALIRLLALFILSSLPLKIKNLLLFRLKLSRERH